LAQHNKEYHGTEIKEACSKVFDLLKDDGTARAYKRSGEYNLTNTAKVLDAINRCQNAGVLAANVTKNKLRGTFSSIIEHGKALGHVYIKTKFIILTHFSRELKLSLKETSLTPLPELLTLSTDLAPKPSRAKILLLSSVISRATEKPWMLLKDITGSTELLALSRTFPSSTYKPSLSLKAKNWSSEPRLTTFWVKKALTAA